MTTPMQNEQSLALRDDQPQLPAISVANKPTSQEMRVVEVNEALLPAYQKASTLEMTDEEITALMANFSDDYVEIRPHDGLIFIPHIHISNRLNQVFKPGKWAMIRRREWFDATSNTMFGEYVLLIRGCYVGESVGGHPFQPNNPKVNYSDTLESTAAESLRRIAGKRLSCGSQVWDPEYARQWVAQYAEQRGGKWYRKALGASKLQTSPTPRPQQQSSPQAQPEPKQATKAAEVPKEATEATRTWMLKELGEAFPLETLHEYTEAKAILLPGESLGDWPLHKVPTSKEALRRLLSDIASFCQNGTAQPPSDAEPTVDEHEGKPRLDGVIERVSVKNGKKKNGEPWTMFGIKIGEQWFNTFSTALGEIAQRNQGGSVTMVYEETERGFNALDIIEGEVTP